MKNLGFTLAEMLVTLGIIGVVSALTLPSLTNHSTTAQIGPKLANAVAVFEQANMSLLNAKGVDRLSDADVLTETGGKNPERATNYFRALSNHLKITPTNKPETWVSKNGVTYTISNPATWFVGAGLAPHRQRLGGTAFTMIDIDLNGTTGPNKFAIDKFEFTLWNDGSLKPVGGLGFKEDGDPKVNEREHWTVKCPNGSVQNNNQYCTGSIFENNLKVLYK